MSLLMEPQAGERLLRFVGDRVVFRLRTDDGNLPAHATAFLRTTLGRGNLVRLEVLGGRGGDRAVDGTAWRNVPMRRDAEGWVVEFTLTEPGFYRSKAFVVDQRGFLVWPEGEDIGLTVHPSSYRTANIIYCAFTRLFGRTREAGSTADPSAEMWLKRLENDGYAVIPASGRLRDLTRMLPHITDTLGCRVLHLLPVNPTPTTYARFGRHGSPYAGLDLTAIDPALVEFDKRTTGVDQFCELAYATHARGARLFLDVVINHTGWGSWLQENHPEWFHRDADGTFLSPGAWGVTWEDLVELDGRHRGLWEHIAEGFLTWCRRGVDGFRCDAGYKVPMPVWRYIIARVREEFPEALFLLEGLGGGWRDTETLLTEGGMQWAYSELFQEYSGGQVAGYLAHAFKQSRRVGLLVHYSETHDNDRLAKKGRRWSLLRNQLSALASVSGGYGFTCGVEWLAAEKIRVHGSTGLGWGQADNLVPELARLNRLLADHPCFFDHAAVTVVSPADSPVLALRRDSAEGGDHVLVLVNTDPDAARAVVLSPKHLELGGAVGTAPVDLLGGEVPTQRRTPEGQVEFTLAPGGACCLAAWVKPRGVGGDAYRRMRAQADLLVKALHARFDPEAIGPFDLPALAGWVESDPVACLAAVNGLDPLLLARDPVAALRAAREAGRYPEVVEWGLADRSRVTLVPPGHWLLVRDIVPFRARLGSAADGAAQNVESVAVQHGHVACFPPALEPGDRTLCLERYGGDPVQLQATVRGLSVVPRPPVSPTAPSADSLVLLTNGRGGMARLGVDLGRVVSKYDCLLAANLHAELPVDRHVFVKRARLWVNAFGFISPLDAGNLLQFDPGPPARWVFRANAGDGRLVDLELTAGMLPLANTTILRLRRLGLGRLAAANRPPASEALDGIRVTLRVDLEDRNFHAETRRNGGADHHFHTHTRALSGRAGFSFQPAADRFLRVFSDHGAYHPQPEWCENLAHPVEASRGQTTSGDAFSPGWFDLPLGEETPVTLVITAEAADPWPAELASGLPTTTSETQRPEAGADANGMFARRLEQAAAAFVVRRDDVKTVIAGYPWFLDWGRDTLICARGLLTAGRVAEVRELLMAFGRFEEGGTLPNIIHGATAGNRDTVDAPLWYGVVCEELAARENVFRVGQGLYALAVDRQGRTVADVLRSIARHYLQGTANGIRVDPESGLVWSPSHFTWMDTNHPAGTPREGYPVEIQALWIRLLRHLDRVGAVADAEPWGRLADRAEASFRERFWLDGQGWLADVLLAARGVPAAQAVPDTALRSNQFIAVSLGLVERQRARRCVAAGLQHLLVPGALRSLAPLRVSPPLPIRGAHGGLLNDPEHPYWGTYQGDEDSRRKPAYHNGTAWVWTLPAFCESLVQAWDKDPAAVNAARAILASTDVLLDEGCLGQLPEILDGDAPHAQRGCDAQAWSVTEVLRVWRQLENGPRR